MGKSQIEPQELVRKKRAALEARLRKESLRSIAERMNVSVSTVKEWVSELLVSELPYEEAAELRVQENDGWDALEARANHAIDILMSQANWKHEQQLPVSGELDQIRQWQEQIAKIKEKRERLNGLAIPVKVEHNVTVRTAFDAEVEALMNDLLGGGKIMTHPELVDLGDE